MIRIDSNCLISFFQSEADKAAASGLPIMAAENQCSADTFRDFAGKLYFYPLATPNVYFYSPLPALPPFSQETERVTRRTFAKCKCAMLGNEDCACWENYCAFMQVKYCVDADGLTAID